MDYVEQRPAWTLMNDPTHYTVCKFHTDPRGNRCAFGQSCEFMHYHQLHRPNIQEMTLSTLLTLNYFLSLLLAHLQPQNLDNRPANHQDSTLNANATPYIPLSEPIGGKHFENYLDCDCKLDVDDSAYDFRDATVDISVADQVLGAKAKAKSKCRGKR